MESSGDPVVPVVGSIDNLAAKSDAELYNAAIDPDVYENSREEAIGLLSKRRNSSSIKQLIGLLTADGVPARVRRAILQAVVDNRIDQALPTLLWLYNHIKPEQDGLALVFVGYNRESLLRARSSLGDITASRDLICRYYLGGPPAWPLHTLIEQLGGMPAVVGQLTSSSGSMEEQLRQLAKLDEDARVRRWSLDRLTEIAEYQPIGFYVEKLGDPASIVAEGASNILIQHSVSAHDALRQIAGDRGLVDNHRLWAIYTLLRMGISADNLLAQIPHSQVPLPEAIPQALRNAIVDEWAEYDAPLSDLRWMIEKQQLSENRSYEVATLIEQLRVELQAADLQIGEAIDCGDYHEQGGGTYWLLPIATDEEDIERYLYVSKLGPFVSYAIHVTTRYDNGYGVSYHLTNLDDIDPIGLWKEHSVVCKQLAEGIGFTWVNEAILDIVVSGLCAPYPYRSEEMTVRLLLYYWID